MTYGSITISRFIETSEWHKPRYTFILLKS